MNDEMERMWKEVVMAYLKYYPIISLKRLRKSRRTSVRLIGVSAEIRTGHVRSEVAPSL
jgi:hypothetical protein